MGNIPTSGGRTNGATDPVASGGLNQQLDFSFGSFNGTRYLEKLTIGSPSKFGSQPFGPSGLNWRFVHDGKTYVAGTDFIVSPANGNATSVSLVFTTPVPLRANSSARVYLPVTGPNGAAPVVATASNCEPENLPEDPPTENPQPTDPDEPGDPEMPAEPEEATERRDPAVGEQRLTVSARAFVPMFTAGSFDDHNARTSTDTRYTAGIRFELWNTSNDIAVALRDGPSSKVDEPWAYCVTDSTGECDIFVPDSYLGAGKRFYVKQVSNAPGTFHIDKVNWGRYGAANDRFEAYLPGPVDSHPTHSSRGVVKPGGKNVQERSYEIPPSKRYDGPDVKSINSNRDRDASQWSSFGSAAQSLNNPPLSQARKCQASGGPKIALVMDVTASIDENGSPQKYRDAVYGTYGFLQSLRGTGAEIAMFNFNESSPGRDQNYPEPLSVDTNMTKLEGQAKSILRSFSSGTNWDSGLNAVKSAIESGQKYDEVIFITDGDANGYGKNGSGDFNDGRSGYVRAIEAAIYRSNEIKEKGTRVVSIGVGSAEDASNWDGSGQLEAISGLKYGEDYFGTDWDRLASTLRAAASQVTCQNEIVVDKTIVDENGRKLPDQSQATKWNVDINVDNVVSEINWSHGDDPVQPAVLSPNASTSDDSLNPLKIHDRRATPDSRWFLTFYGNAEPGSKKANRADISISEDTNSRAGYIFVPGTGQKSTGGYSGRGSWYEIRNLRYDTVLETGPMTSPNMKFPELPQDRKLIVHLQNQPSVAVHKGTAQSVVSVNADNTWTARYEVRANGTSDSKTRIPRITDEPGFPDGFEITKVAVDGEPRQLKDGKFEVAAEGSRSLSKNDIASYTVVVEGVYTRKNAQGTLVPLETLGDELKCEADGSDGPGKGMFNEVFMTPDVDGQANNRACIPIVPNPPKKPSVEKTFVDVTPVSTSTAGEQLVTFRINVKGDPSSDLNFDLTDRTAFAPGIEIQEVRARFLGGSSSGNPGLGRSFTTLTKQTDSQGTYWKVASGTVPKQGVFEYEIQFRVKGLDKVQPEDRKCESTGNNDFRRWTPQEGFYNQATLGWGTTSNRQTQDVDACGDIDVQPKLSVEKSVAQHPQTVTTADGKLHDDRSTGLQYRIVVSNTGTGPGTYTLRDMPLFANGVELLSDHHGIVSAEVVNASTGNKTDLKLPGYTVYVDGNRKLVGFGFARDLEIAPNTSHVYIVQVAYGEKTDFFSNENQRDSVCASTPGDDRKGLNNKAQLVSVKNPAAGNAEVPGDPGEYVDYACANIPPEPSISKEITNEKLTLDDTVSYNVTVRNPDGGVARRIDVTDIPKFGKNITVDPKSVKVDGRSIEYEAGKELALGTVELKPGESKTFVVSAKYTAKSGEFNPEAICSTSDYGLNNTGKIYFAYFPDRSAGKRPRLSDSDDACGLVRTDLKIGVQKFGADKAGNVEEIDPTTGGYQFELRETGPDAAAPRVLDAVAETQTGTQFNTVDAPLKANTEYELVETKAPAGYSLLAEPVKFRVVATADGVQVQFYDSVSQKWANKLVNVSASSTGENAGLQLISVTDVHSGTLPRTGGNGLWPITLLGLSIVGLGAAVGARRKSA
ncbi:SpaA isopeptide-forming pilin-related protein [Corynebacterium sp. Q4381]|uniref:SpaA isopeptide-forming pilin-related protein n=1 Tax=Corynebacterium sp. Marseille-Q4381 TaxID=3121597 RepID=UPI002FE6545B